MNEFKTNLGVKPLGRGQVASAVVQAELARFKQYKEELNDAARVADPLLKAKKLRVAFVSSLELEGRFEQAKRVRELCASLKLQVE